VAAAALPDALLGRYALVTRARGVRTGERSARESGQSVEFLDYRPYQPGDEPRAVDWRAYARSGRLYTRLYHAERAADLHVLLDTSPSMRLHGKGRWAGALARVLTGLGRHEAGTRVHLLDGRASAPGRGRRDVVALRRFVDAAGEVPEEEDVSLAERWAGRLLSLPPHPGAAVAVAISDLLDPAPLRPLLAAARARRVDLVLLQTLAAAELGPEGGRFELVDVEDGSLVEVGPEEARAYRDAVRDFVARIRAETLSAGQRHVLVPAPEEAGDRSTDDVRLERSAFAALVRAGVVARR
jgi:uncharacterized protein (DUF58 family)